MTKTQEMKTKEMLQAGKLLRIGDLQFFGDKNKKRLDEIDNRLNEIREMLGDEEKRGDNKFSDLEKEVRELNAEKEEIEARQRMQGQLGKDNKPEGEPDGGEPEKRSNFRKVSEEEPKTPEQEEREAFDKYLETREMTDGLKTEEGYVVVPEEESKEIIELADDIVSLKQYVTVKKVSTPAGTQPVRTTERAKLSTVKELDASPKIGVIPFTEVDYKVSTKRGYIPYSNEYKQDGINLVPDLKKYMGEVVINTENDDILTELGKVRTKTVNSVDQLKTLYNTGFSAGKRQVVKAFVSQSVFDNLDRIKDKNGRYLLQESITSSTGYKLLGRDIVVLDDDLFPNKKTAFIGDLREIIYFDRAQTDARWENYLHYGECLSVAIRNDVGRIEDDKTKVNIYKVTIDIPTEVEESTP